MPAHIFCLFYLIAILDTRAVRNRLLVSRDLFFVNKSHLFKCEVIPSRAKRINKFFHAKLRFQEN